MEFECIIYQKEADIAIIRLNRPKVLNAMNRQLWIDFQAALEDAGRDAAVKVVIITGEGRAFPPAPI
ncbi:3-hydroxybutyryl-CoA dehydratase (EC [Olavius algarvensis associated proteobacterium Delta 3]|nr:3-hydroxybutyryl-CoA dehydratase (EC [Olavius algarvensis associated proteobacterium Delta 3]